MNAFAVFLNRSSDTDRWLYSFTIHELYLKSKKTLVTSTKLY